jgi:hypothetical protein
MYLQKALNELINTGWHLDNPQPTTEAEFNERFSIQTGVSGQDAVMSNNPSDFGVTWSQVQTKAAELEAAAPMELLREVRNSFLAQTDWWANSDLTMTQAQRDYRQALRDITDTYSSIDDVVWPTKP